MTLTSTTRHEWVDVAGRRVTLITRIDYRQGTPGAGLEQAATEVPAWPYSTLHCIEPYITIMGLTYNQETIPL
jgi:hypothetical protein